MAKDKAFNRRSDGFECCSQKVLFQYGIEKDLAQVIRVFELSVEAAEIIAIGVVINQQDQITRYFRRETAHDTQAVVDSGAGNGADHGAEVAARKRGIPRCLAKSSGAIIASIESRLASSPWAD